MLSEEFEDQRAFESRPGHPSPMTLTPYGPCRSQKSQSRLTPNPLQKNPKFRFCEFCSPVRRAALADESELCKWNSGHVRTLGMWETRFESRFPPPRRTHILFSATRKSPDIRNSHFLKIRSWTFGSHCPTSRNGPGSATRARTGLRDVWEPLRARGSSARCAGLVFYCNFTSRGNPPTLRSGQLTGGWEKLLREARAIAPAEFMSSRDV